jgi:hypothetical protein
MRWVTPLKPIESVLAQPLLDESLLRLMRLMARTLLCSPAEGGAGRAADRRALSAPRRD